MDVPLRSQPLSRNAAADGADTALGRAGRNTDLPAIIPLAAIVGPCSAVSKPLPGRAEAERIEALRQCHEDRASGRTPPAHLVAQESALIESLQPRALALCRRHARPPVDGAEDLAQGILEEFVQHLLASFEFDEHYESIAGYFATFVQLKLKRFRKKGPRSPAFIHEGKSLDLKKVLDHRPSTDGQSALDDLKHAVDDVVPDLERRLDAVDREIFRLRFLERRKIASIAADEGLTVKQTEKRAVKIRKLFDKLLRHHPNIDSFRDVLPRPSEPRRINRGGFLATDETRMKHG